MQICSYVFPLLKFASEINSSHATLIPVRESFKRNQSARNHINEIFGQQKASDRIMNFVSIIILVPYIPYSPYSQALSGNRQYESHSVWPFGQLHKHVKDDSS